MVWAGLVFAKLLGFDFGVDLKIFFGIVFLFFVFFSAYTAAKNWEMAKKILKNIWVKTRTPIEEDLLRYKKPFERKIHLPFVVTKHFLRMTERIFFNKFFLFACLMVGISFDVFFIASSSDVIILFFTLLWIFVIRMYRFEGRVSVAGGLAFLTLCPFLLMAGKGSIAEKTAIWAYIFLSVGVVKMILETRKEIEKNEI